MGQILTLGQNKWTNYESYMITIINKTFIFDIHLGEGRKVSLLYPMMIFLKESPFIL